MVARFDVFLSHAWGDHADDVRVGERPQRAGVERLRDELRAAGLRVFYDEGSIEQFDHLADTIRDSLDASKVLVAWCSDLYLSRPACASELTHAITSTVGSAETRVLVVNTEPDVDHLPGPLREQLVPPAPMPDDDEGFAGLVAAIVDRVDRVDDGLGAASAGSVLTEWYPEEIDSSTRFTGRFRELWELHGMLTGSALASQRETRSGVVVSGMGGSGKSMLVIEYAHRFGAAWPGGIVWLAGHGFDQDRPDEPLSSAEYARRSLELLAATDLEIDVEGLTLEELRSEIERWFEGRVNGPVLWIVDDFADDADVGAWIAPMDDAVTIFTTRVNSFDGVFEPLRLDQLSDDDAFELLTRDHRPVSDAQRDAANTIVERLGHHALALDVTRCRVRTPGDYGDLLERLDHRPVATLERAARNVGRLAVDHSASITATLQESIDDLSEHGLDVLDLASVFDSAPLPDELMMGAVEWRAVLATADDVELTDDEFLELRDDAIDGLADLERHSLARREGVNTRVHRLVVDLARDLLDRDEATDGPSGEEGGRGRSALAREAVDHAAVDALDSAVDPRDQRRIYDLAADLAVSPESDLPLRLGAVDLELRRLDAALERLADCVSQRELAFGADDELTLAARGEYADALSSVDEWAAIDLRRALLDDHERIFGPDDPDTVFARKHLASRLSLAGSDEAIEHRERVIADFERILGDDDRDTLWALRDLAGTLMLLGHADEAIEAGRVAVEEFERVLGSDAEDTIRVRSSFGINLWGAGHDDAIDVLATAARDFAGLFGDDHPDTLWARQQVAHAMHDAGDERALDTYRAIADDAIRILGPEHPETLEARLDVARALDEVGEHDAARLAVDVVVDAFERTLGPDHPDTAAARVALDDEGVLVDDDDDEPGRRWWSFGRRKLGSD